MEINGNILQNEMMWTAGIQMKWICDHRSESQFKQLQNSPKKFFGAPTGFEPVASALALQCSTSLSYEDPYTGGRPIYWVHQPVKGMKHRMKWCELREYKWNKYVTIAVNRNFIIIMAWLRERRFMKFVHVIVDCRHARGWPDRCGRGRPASSVCREM